VVLTPRRWRQACGNIRRRWWQESPVTRESTEEPVKTIACGNAGCSGVSVVTNACAFYFAHAAAGAWAPGIPHALLGGKPCNGPDALRRGVVNACLDQERLRGNNSGFFFAPALKGLARSPEGKEIDRLASIGESRQNA
jgi:hypothetical protein